MPRDTHDFSPESNGNRKVSWRELLTGKFRLAPLGENCPSHETARKSHKPRVWGFIGALFGVTLLIGSIYWEERLSRPQTAQAPAAGAHGPEPSGATKSEERTHLSLPASLGLQLMGHIGIAFFILGIVGFATDLTHWTKYFEQRLASTITEKQFLKTLKNQELDALLEDIFLSRFKVERFETKSFLHFFTTRIQKFIGSSFRENVSRTMTIEPIKGDERHCSVELDVRYKCRKIAGESSTIQKSVIFQIDRPDLKVDDPKREIFPGDYVVTLTIPASYKKKFSSPAGFPKVSDGKIVVKKEHFAELKKHKKGEMVTPTDEKNFYKFELSLRDFCNMDELEVQQQAKYSIPVGRFNTWGSPYPSKGVHAVFKYPEDKFECKVESLGMDPEKQQIVDQPGLYSLDYDSWLLPESGVVYGFFSVADKPGSRSGNVEGKGSNAEQKQAPTQSSSRPHETNDHDEFVFAQGVTDDGRRVSVLLVPE